MPIYILNDSLWFPSQEEFDGDVVAVGGDLRAERLLHAYASGIFPWYNDPGEIYWWCPESRCVLYMEELRISHSMRTILNRNKFKVTFNRDFVGVLEGCRSGERINNTWLLDEMVEAYTQLHKQGYAHSVEIWENGTLVGGLYGIILGHMFYGESMFSKVSNSSKVGFIHLVEYLKKKGWKMIDCQVYNNHLGSLGAREIPREQFLNELREQLKYPTSLQL